jgi:hypothetical protein
MPVCKSIPYSAPVSGFRRRHKAIRARSACSVRDTFENFDSVIVDAAYFAKRSFGDDKFCILRTQLLQEYAARNGEGRDVLQEVATRRRRDAKGWGHDGLLASDLITQVKLFAASHQLKVRPGRMRK